MGYHFSHFQVINIPDQKRSCSKPGWDSTGWPRCNKSPEMEELGLVPGHHPHHHPDYHHNTAGRLPRGWFDGSELVSHTTRILSRLLSRGDNNIRIPSTTHFQSFHVPGHHHHHYHDHDHHCWSPGHSSRRLGRSTLQREPCLLNRGQVKFMRGYKIQNTIYESSLKC